LWGKFGEGYAFSWLSVGDAVVLQWIMQVGHQNFRKLCGGVLVCAGYVSFIKRYLTAAKLIKNSHI